MYPVITLQPAIQAPAGQLQMFIPHIMGLLDIILPAVLGKIRCITDNTEKNSGLGPKHLWVVVLFLFNIYVTYIDSLNLRSYFIITVGFFCLFVCVVCLSFLLVW